LFLSIGLIPEKELKDKKFVFLFLPAFGKITYYLEIILTDDGEPIYTIRRFIFIV